MLVPLGVTGDGALFVARQLALLPLVLLLLFELLLLLPSLLLEVEEVVMVLIELLLFKSSTPLFRFLSDALDGCTYGFNITTSSSDESPSSSTAMTACSALSCALS